MSIVGNYKWHSLENKKEITEENKLSHSFSGTCARLAYQQFREDKTVSISQSESLICIFEGILLKRTKIAARLGLDYSASPAQVLLNLYHSNAGKLYPKQLNGNFLIVIADINTGSFLLIRDRISAKAVYYTRNEYGLFWSTSLPLLLDCPGISRKVSKVGFSGFWNLEFGCPPHTVWHDIKVLPNAHLLCIGHSNDLSINHYAHVPYTPKLNLNRDKVAQQTRKILLEIVADNLAEISGPFAILLTAGIDSNVILACCSELGRKPEAAITFRCPGENDETELAALSAKHFGVHHEIVEFPVSELVDQVNQIVEIWGQPYAHSSVIGIMSMMPIIQKHARYLLTGDGGGEAFLGPGKKYAKQWRQVRYTLSPLTLAARELTNSIYPLFCGNSLYRKLSYLAELLTAKYEVEEWINKRPITRAESRAVIKKKYLDFVDKKLLAEPIIAWKNPTASETESLFTQASPYLWNQGVYTKTCTVAAWHGVTVLSPLTDQRFLDYMASIPLAIKGSTIQKVTLRRAFQDILPIQILNAPKKGFATPLRRLIGQSDIQNLVEGNKIFNSDNMTSIIEAHKNGYVPRTALLFSACIVSSWLEQFNPDFG
ncbi:hypothetical protein D0962_24055 [Leptolyngbyaceae cyanobacterium CCMR0082]|uniref:asparagine synthase (glutamine-hydrolyzing) n=1 Tax=Adonisia turfae CCMR0082 TaxID=2304604 RepID=A0A6M0SCK5_9CYAN|nr:asparagine synthetase B family protein [Adonisia turfae]NEZ65793.1 hypothetical protein [Adonisia turfae CCMR0082]